MKVKIDKKMNFVKQIKITTYKTEERVLKVISFLVNIGESRALFESNRLHKLGHYISKVRNSENVTGTLFVFWKSFYQLRMFLQLPVH